MVTVFVTYRCYKSREFAQASLLRGTVAQVRDKAHGPLVIYKKNSNTMQKSKLVKFYD